MLYKETKELDQKFDAPSIENRCIEYWENAGVYRFDATVAHMRVINQPVRDCNYRWIHSVNYLRHLCHLLPKKYGNPCMTVLCTKNYSQILKMF